MRWNPRPSALVLGATLSCLCRPAPAVEEPFCSEPPTDCSEDVFSIRFAATGTSEMSGSDLEMGDAFETHVFLDVNTPKVVGRENCLQPPPPPECDFEEPQPPITECSNIQSLGYEIRHDPSLLEIELATLRGADPLVRLADFNITGFTEDRLGMMSTVAISIDGCPPLDLPPEAKNLKLAVARYKVKAPSRSTGARSGSPRPASAIPPS